MIIWRHTTPGYVFTSCHLLNSNTIASQVAKLSLSFSKLLQGSSYPSEKNTHIQPFNLNRFIANFSCQETPIRAMLIQLFYKTRSDNSISDCPGAMIHFLQRVRLPFQFQSPPHTVLGSNRPTSAKWYDGLNCSSVLVPNKHNLNTDDKRWKRECIKALRKAATQRSFSNNDSGYDFCEKKAPSVMTPMAPIAHPQSVESEGHGDSSLRSGRPS